MNKNDDYLESQFFLSDFKLWVEKNDKNLSITNKRKSEGMEVESKIPVKKLINIIEVEEGNLLELTREFKNNGGIIFESCGDVLVIKVANGLFRVPKHCVKRKT